MPFDIDGARKAGYSDTEIANYLATDKSAGFDVAGALKSGYSPSEVLDFMSKPQEKGVLESAWDGVKTAAGSVVNGVKDDVASLFGGGQSSVMDKAQQPDPETTGAIDAGAGPIRQDKYAQIKSEIKALPIAEQVKIAQGSDLHARIARNVVPNSVRQAERLASGDMTPVTQEDVADSAAYQLTKKPEAATQEPINDSQVMNPMGDVSGSIDRVAQPDDPNAVGAIESLARSYLRGSAEIGKDAALLSTAPAILYDKVRSAFSGQDETGAQDYMFKHMVDPWQSVVDWHSIKPTEKQSFLAKVASGVGGMLADLPYMIISGGASAEADAVANIAPSMREFMANTVERGFDAMRPIMVKAGTEKAEEVLNKGGTVSQAIAAAGTAALWTGYMGSAPMSLEGSLMKRLATGVPVGMAVSEIGRQVQNASMPDDMQQPFSMEENLVGGVTGAVMAGAMGHRARAEMQSRGELGYMPEKTPIAKAVDDAVTTAKVADDANARQAMSDLTSAKTVDQAIEAATRATDMSNTLEALKTMAKESPADLMRTIRPLESEDAPAIEPQPARAEVDLQKAVDAAATVAEPTLPIETKAPQVSDTQEAPALSAAMAREVERLAKKTPDNLTTAQLEFLAAHHPDEHVRAVSSEVAGTRRNASAAENVAEAVPRHTPQPADAARTEPLQNSWRAQVNEAYKETGIHSPRLYNEVLRAETPEAAAQIVRSMAEQGRGHPRLLDALHTAITGRSISERTASAVAPAPVEAGIPASVEKPAAVETAPVKIPAPEEPAKFFNPGEAYRPTELFRTKTDANMHRAKANLAALAEEKEGGWALKAAPRELTERERFDSMKEVKHLNTALEGAGMKPVSALKAIPGADHALAAEVGKLFGTKVVFVSESPQFQGVAHQGAAFVTAATKHPVLAVTGHEVLHSLEQSNPELAGRLKEQIRQYLKEDAVDERHIREELASGSKHSKDVGVSEALADINGSLWMDSRFWKALAERDANLFRTVGYRFMELLTKAANSLRGTRFDIDALVTDANAVRKIMADAWAEHIKQRDNTQNEAKESTVEKPAEPKPVEKSTEPEGGRGTEEGLQEVDGEGDGSPRKREDRQREVSFSRTEEGSERLAEFLRVPRKIVTDFRLATVPMAEGSDIARKVAKDYANQERRAQWQWNKFDEVLRKNFTEEQLEKMWNTADEENDLRRDGIQDPTRGLGRLNDKERETVELLHAYGEQLMARARDTGMFEGDGVPYWTPRMAVMVGADGEYSRPAVGQGAESGSSEGRNISTSASSLKHRKYLTSAETEAAMQAKLNDGDKTAQLVRNIRTMPMAMARLERAIAARELINQIKSIGQATGHDTVTSDEGPDFFTLDHPAFKTWRPKFVEVDGKMQPAVDQNGDMMFERVPIYISNEFKGPLKAVMSVKPDAVYQGLMALKSKSMGLIMYSPLIHNAVEWGRAIPAMDAKGKLTLGLYTYISGNKAKNTPEIMREAIDHGLVPIGGRGQNMDITGIMDDPTMEVGRSWTAKALAAPVALMSEKGALNVKKAVDAAGKFWHETLLWDRVADLQMGLYVSMKNSLINKGMSNLDAATVAAHFANRYAGALPRESMSEGARRIANLALFSRSFTLGNLGALKDMFAGLPKDLQSQIKISSGELALQAAQSYARRKAIATFVIDVGLMYVANSLLQDWLQREQFSGWKDWMGSYANRGGTLYDKLKSDPIAVISHPFNSLESLTSTGENEPGKEERIKWGEDATGTNIYVRLPTGKIGEEFANYANFPTGTMKQVKAKFSTFLRPIYETFTNDKGFGQKVYDESQNASTLKNIGKVVWNFMKAQVPSDQILAAYDLASGHGDDMDAKKIVGPFVGLTFSKGAPGGPAVGEMYQESRDHQDKVTQIMPDVKRALKLGDEERARELMESADMTPREIATTIRHIESPETRLSASAMRHYNKHAGEESKERMERFRGQ